MKRTMFVIVVTVVLMGTSTNVMAGARSREIFRDRYGDYYRARSRERFPDGYRSWPGVRVDVGYGSYGYDYGYSRGPAGYPDRSLFDFLTGETDRKALEITEKDQDFQQEQERRAEDKEILARAAQRGRDQKIEGENQALKKKVDELEKTSQLTKTQQIEEENKKLKERIAEMEKKIDQLLAAKGK